MSERNVLGGDLEACSLDPVTGWFRDGTCRTAPDDHGSHTICAVVTPEFLEHQRAIGNDLATPRPEFHFPGLSPGDRWCVTAATGSWRTATVSPRRSRSQPPASGRSRSSPSRSCAQHAVDVPDDPRDLDT
jgi:uncharacterized protein